MPSFQVKLTESRLGPTSVLVRAEARWRCGRPIRRGPADGGSRPSTTIVDLDPITTTGDLITDKPLREFGGKGLFTKEIDDALLAPRSIWPCIR